MSTAPLTSSPTTDPWSDARLAARNELGEDVLRPARRRHWYRCALVGAAHLAFAVVVLAGAYTLADPRTDDLSARWSEPWIGFAILCLGVVVQLVGSTRRSRATSDLPGTPADALLPADDRRWVRAQISTGSPVSAERRLVAVDRARRLVGEANQVFAMSGFVVLMLGLVVMSPGVAIIGAAVVLSVYAIASAVRDLVRSRRARQWLALHAEPTA